MKSLFIKAFEFILATLEDQEILAFSFKALLSCRLDRHGPAYTLGLEWCRGQLYNGLKIQIDLSLAVRSTVILQQWQSILNQELVKS